MKILAIIFSCLLVVSLVGLIVSASVAGVSVMNSGFPFFNIGWHGNWDWDFNWEPAYNVDRVFNGSYDNIEIGIVSARLNISISSDGETRVSYKNDRPNIEFIAEVRNNTLVVRERVRGWGIIGSWGGQATLDIEIPEAVYKSIDISLTSGRINGELPETDSFAFSVVSGSLNLRGLSGRGSVNLVSGTVDIDFARWDDTLKIDIVSGSTSITVPGGSGADLRFSRVSGSLNYDMDGDSGKLSRSGSAAVGGSNRQRVDVDLVSGSADIRTR
jgi:hypothetical protein